MNIKQWYLKTFKRDQIVRLVYTGEDKRVKTSFIIPDNEIITYKEKSYMLVPDLVYTLEGIPTVFANHKKAELIDIYDTTKSEYTPKQFNLAIEANVADQLYRAGNSNKLDELMPILLIGVIGVVFYVIYLMGQNQAELLERITQLEQIIGG